MPPDTDLNRPVRLRMYRFVSESGPETFAEDVRAGLSARPKFLPPKYFYDGLGSRLFEAICELPEYYLTRAESEILRNHAEAIIAAVPGPSRLIELGSGSAEKTRFLIEALLHRQDRLHYLPIDISETSLERSTEELLRVYPHLSITAFVADYFQALGALWQRDDNERRSERTIALFLGSNIGNFEPDQSLAFLRMVRRVLRPADAMLVGADLKKPPEILIPAYDDALGVTAAFNLNLLVRINREMGGDFDLKKFEHRAIYNEELGRVEMHLVSRERQTVRIQAIDLEAGFERGETIHTENSYKYDLEQLSRLAAQAGFSLAKTWFDSARRFSFNLLTAV
jgi:L-histidine Nalpha-methyltransferase